MPGLSEPAHGSRSGCPGPSYSGFWSGDYPGGFCWVTQRHWRRNGRLSGRPQGCHRAWQRSRPRRCESCPQASRTSPERKQGLRLGTGALLPPKPREGQRALALVLSLHRAASLQPHLGGIRLIPGPHTDTSIVARQILRVWRGLGFGVWGRRGSLETGGACRKHAQWKDSRGRVPHSSGGPRTPHLLSSLSRGVGNHFFFIMKIVAV